MDNRNIGQMIREARLAKGMTQSALGQMIGYTAMAISHFEKGTRPVRQNDMSEIFKILGMNEPSNQVASTTLFRASGARGSITGRDRSLNAFDKFVNEKYGSGS